MAAILVLVIAGLAVGLVLVAQQVQMTNSVSVTYTADNVECDITAYAIHHIADVESAESKTIDLNNIDSTKMEIVQVSDGDSYVNSVTDEIRAYESDGIEINSNKSWLFKHRSFAPVTLRAVAAEDSSTTSSVVIYYFEIINKSGFTITVSPNYDEPEDDDNVIISGYYNGTGLQLLANNSMLVKYSIKIDNISNNANYNGSIRLMIGKSTAHQGGADD